MHPLHLAWAGLETRSQSVLQRRLHGETLEQIAVSYDITRERIRQIERDGNTHLNMLVGVLFAAQAQTLLEKLKHIKVISVHELALQWRVEVGDWLRAVLHALGFEMVRIWRWQTLDWWTLELPWFQKELTSIAALAPLSEADVATGYGDFNVPPMFPLSEVLDAERSPVVHQEGLGWVRKKRRPADAAYLWLSKQVEAVDIEEIARHTHATSPRSLAEALRRDSERFVQVRPEGTWALCDWKHLEQTQKYRNATEAVLSVLNDSGPLDYPRLESETLRRYPVTPWRIGQCLYSIKVGQWPNGLYDLSERGAPVKSPKQAQKPETIAESGSLIALRLRVTSDVTRGSGIGINNYVSWRLGLHHYPSSRTFSGQFEVVIRRTSSGTSISSLRSAAVNLGASHDCDLIVVLDLETGNATIKHACSLGKHP